MQRRQQGDIVTLFSPHLNLLPFSYLVLAPFPAHLHPIPPSSGLRCLGSGILLKEYRLQRVSNQLISKHIWSQHDAQSPVLTTDLWIMEESVP